MFLFCSLQLKLIMERGGGELDNLCHSRQMEWYPKMLNRNLNSEYSCIQGLPEARKQAAIWISCSSSLPTSCHSTITSLKVKWSLQRDHSDWRTVAKCSLNRFPTQRGAIFAVSHLTQDFFVRFHWSKVDLVRTHYKKDQETVLSDLCFEIKRCSITYLLFSILFAKVQ